MFENSCVIAGRSCLEATLHIQDISESFVVPVHQFLVDLTQLVSLDHLHEKEPMRTAFLTAPVQFFVVSSLPIGQP